MSTAEIATSSDVDLFFVGDRLGRALFENSRTSARPSSLQSIISESCTKMFVADAPFMPQCLAGKVFGKLLRPGRTGLSAQPLQPNLQGCFDFCLESLRKHDGYRDLAEGLRRVSGQLAWASAPSGPFSSMSFENSNSHAVIVGPGGREDRADARIGITILSRYARMPDHRLQSPRAYLALTPFEFSTESTGWVKAQVGSVCFAPADEIVAYRCTTTPLLMIWCDVPFSSTFTTRK